MLLFFSNKRTRLCRQKSVLPLRLFLVVMFLLGKVSHLLLDTSEDRKAQDFLPIERQLKNLLVALLPPKMAEMRKSGREIKVLVVQFGCNAG